MDTDAISIFYRYGAWAMDRLFEALDDLSTSELDAPGCSGNGSIRETLAHLLSVERSWFSWFDGSLTLEAAYAHRIEASELMTIDDARRIWGSIAAQEQRFVASLSNEDLASVKRTETARGKLELPLGSLLFHVANHGTHTRAQIVAAIRRTGRDPGVFEFLWFAMQERKKTGATRI